MGLPLAIGGAVALFTIGKGIYDSIKQGEHNSQMEKILAAKKPTVTSSPVVSGPGPASTPVIAPPPAPVMSASAGPAPMPAPYTPPSPTEASPISGPPPPFGAAATPPPQTGFGGQQEPENPWLASVGQKFTPGPWA